MGLFFLSSMTLFQRELIRFIRQKNRIIGALGTPIVFWFFIGSGLNDSVQMPLNSTMPGPTNYLQFFIPGTILLIILFTSIFSTISIIEDRREGFLQGVLVSPAPRSALVLGKLLGGALLAFVQGLLFIGLVLFMKLPLTLNGILYASAILFSISFGLTGLGFVLAWRLDSTQGFHAIMNLFLMPLWLLSGALFPIAQAPGWLKTVMIFNPLSYAVSGLHQGLFGTYSSSNALLSSGATCLLVIILFSIIMFFLSYITASKIK